MNSPWIPPEFHLVSTPKCAKRRVENSAPAAFCPGIPRWRLQDSPIKAGSWTSPGIYGGAGQLGWFTKPAVPAKLNPVHSRAKFVVMVYHSGASRTHILCVCVCVYVCVIRKIFAVYKYGVLDSKLAPRPGTWTVKEKKTIRFRVSRKQFFFYIKHSSWEFILSKVRQDNLNLLLLSLLFKVVN